MDAAVAFAVAAALHAGFQLTVTALVYPALASRGAAEWAEAHARHSRAITPLVGLVYLAVVVAGGALVLAGPNPAGWVALAVTALALATTAAGAAPLHGRLSSRNDALVRRLVLLDRVRCAAAVTGVVVAAGSLI